MTGSWDIYFIPKFTKENWNEIEDTPQEHLLLSRPAQTLNTSVLM